MTFPLIHGLLGVGGAESVANGIDFDGTNDWLSRGAELTGISDGKLGTVSVWFKSSNSGGQTVLTNTLGPGDGFFIALDGANGFSVRGNNVASSEILRIKTSTAVNDGAWHHFAASWDLGNDNKFVYLDGSADLTEDVFTDDTLDYTLGAWNIGAFTNADDPPDDDKFVGCIADLWFDDGYVDLSANISKYISGGNPVDLGADGSLPTGSSPLVYQAGATATWHTNKGTGGGFTENGVLAACATDP